MKVFFPFHEGDYSRARTWMEWATELGLTGEHDIFLMPSKTMNDLEFDALERIAAKVFRNVTVVRDYEGLSGWPQGPNSCIRQAGWFFDGLQIGPWMFLENDAIPLVPDWLDQLEAEYLRVGKPFMGRLVPAFKDALGGLVPDHMTGNMICPANTPSQSPRLLTASDVAFDVYAAKEVVPKAHNTLLIQHVFNINGKPPTFPTRESLSLLQPGAVLFHRVKDGSLIERLREQKRLGSGNGAEGEPTTGLDSLHRTPGTNFPQIESVIVDRDAAANRTPQRVFTYYADVPSMDRGEQEWLIARWKENWRNNGWEPVVLTISDSEFKKEELNTFLAFPSKNPKEYELACWARWVAMRARGGLMVDYDVMSYGFTPDCLPDYNNCVRLFDGYVPCAVYGREKDYANIVQEFMQLPPRSETHWSDMLAMEALQGRYDTGHECVEYGKPGWETAKLVHYAHGTCGGRSRKDVIPEAEWMRGFAASLLNPGNAGDVLEGHEILIQAEPMVQIVSDLDAAIATLKAECTTPLGKARIVKRLRAAGVIPDKPKKKRVLRVVGN